MGTKGDIPKRLSQKTASKLLGSDGWTQTLGGKHVVKMEKPGERPITLPYHRGQEYGVGLTHDILRQAGLKATEPDDEATEAPPKEAHDQ